MKEIIELNNRILTDARGAIPKEFGFLLVMRHDNCAKELAALPPDIRAGLEDLRAKLNRAIPNDFGYVMSLGLYEPLFQLTYADGQAEGNCPIAWDENRSIFYQLSELDWDQHRGGVLQNGAIFDDMRKLAKKLDPKFPKTKEIQKDFAAQVDVFYRTKREDASRVYILKWRDDEGFSEEVYPDIKSLCDALIDIMTVQYLVLAVTAEGKPVPPSIIDGYKLQTLKELRKEMPISYVRALGIV